MRTVPLVPFRMAALEPIRIDTSMAPSAAWCLLWLIVPAWWLFAAWCFL